MQPQNPFHLDYNGLLLRSFAGAAWFILTNPGFWVLMAVVVLTTVMERRMRRRRRGRRI
jgi:hypothetical protein